MKTMQVFDCQDMPTYHRLGVPYNDERNLCSKFLKLHPEQDNDSYVTWGFHSMSDEELEESFDYDKEDLHNWNWKATPLEAAKEVNQWLRDNGATDDEVLIAHWW